MKRDINLIKEILIALEESENDHAKLKFTIEGSSDVEVSYHVKILHQAGLIDADNLSGASQYKWVPISLTWQGHEFIDAIRNDTVWQKLKAKLTEQSGNIPFQVLKEMATMYARDIFI